MEQTHFDPTTPIQLHESVALHCCTFSTRAMHVSSTRLHDPVAELYVCFYNTTSSTTTDSQPTLSTSATQLHTNHRPTYSSRPNSMPTPLHPAPFNAQGTVTELTAELFTDGMHLLVVELAQRLGQPSLSPSNCHLAIA